MQARPRSSSPLDSGSARPVRAGGWSRWLILFVLLAAAPGCFTYRTADVQSLAPGEEIRVEVGSDQFSPTGYGSSFLGPRRVEGRFVDVTDESLVLSLWIGSAYRGTPFETAYQDIEIPRSDLAQVASRELSRGRTAIAAAGTLGLIWFLIDSIVPTRNEVKDGDGDPGIGPPEGSSLRVW